MAVDLIDYVDVLRREVTPPGSSLFGTVSDEQLVGYLADAFWEAYLDAAAPGQLGYSPVQALLLPYKCDVDGIVTPRVDDFIDISREAIALVIIYAGLKILRNQLITTNSSNSVKAKAGPVEYQTETHSSANLLTELAKQLQQVRDRLLSYEDAASEVFLIDAFTTRAFQTMGPYAAHVADTLFGALGSESDLLQLNSGG